MVHFAAAVAADSFLGAAAGELCVATMEAASAIAKTAEKRSSVAEEDLPVSLVRAAAAAATG